MKRRNMVGVLSAQGLTKAFGDIVALDHLDLSVSPGEVFGFVGSNGAGKTTAMRIILGVLEPDSGVVMVGDEQIDLNMRRRIGYMPEERGLYPKMKVGEQLVHLAMLHGLSRTEATESMMKWTERLGVQARRDDEVQKLSLGNQQRVQLAAALTHNPNVLILDEPFSGLDPVAVDVMSGVLRERAQEGVPVLFSSHQLDLVERLCDSVGIVRAGRMVANGSIDSLKREGVSRWAITLDHGESFIPPEGTRVVESDGQRFVLEPDGVDPQAILIAGMSTGPVREFREVLPTLTDLFRHVVTQGEEELAAGGVR